MCQLKMNFNSMKLVIVSESFYGDISKRWHGFQGFESSSIYLQSKYINYSIKRIERLDDFEEIKWELKYMQDCKDIVLRKLSQMKFRDVY